MTDPTAPERIWLNAVGHGADHAASSEPVAGAPEYLRAGLARAQVAAAHEAAAVAAEVRAKLSRGVAGVFRDYGKDHAETVYTTAAEDAEALAAAIRALTDADARAALDAMLDEARAQEREAILQAADAEKKEAEGLIAENKRDVMWSLAVENICVGRISAASNIIAAIRARGAAQEGGA